MSSGRDSRRRQRQVKANRVETSDSAASANAPASRLPTDNGRKSEIDAPAKPLVSQHEDSAAVGKRVGFYQASIESFLENRMERDKSLLTLSTAGVGVVITLWTTIGVATSWEFGLGIGAALSFMVAILLVLRTFAENANYLEALITSQDFERPQARLRWLDRCLSAAFYIGLLLALAGSILLTHRKYFTSTQPIPEGASMTDKSDKTSTEAGTGIGGSKPVNEGVQGFQKLAPKIDTGSLKNFHTLAPNAPPATEPPPPRTTAPDASAKPNVTNTKKP